jgi:hypothetical protein
MGGKMQNVEFTYLYRDGGNYKKWGKVVFSDSAQTNINSLEGKLRQGILGGWFVHRKPDKSARNLSVRERRVVI